jgi:methanogenic corrinoid protein MtbC1
MLPTIPMPRPGKTQALSELLPVPFETSQAYDDARPEVVARVDAALFRRPDLGVLLGDSSASVVRELNRYLSAFFSSVFSLGLPELVTEGLPRMLSGYRSRGVSFDYLEVLPTLWRGALGDQMGPKGRPIESVLDWMDHHPAAWIPAESAVPDIEPSPGLEARLSGALLAGDAPGARAVLQKAIQGGADLPEVFVELIQPALYDIGQRWEDGRISAAQEHLASALVSRLLAGLDDSGPARSDRVAVVTTAPTETHEFGAWMVADVLRNAGWTVHFLGSQLPAEETIRFLRSVEPGLLAISVTLEIHLPSLRELVEALRAEPELREIPVLVGGQAFGDSDRVWRSTGADGRAYDVRSLAEQAERLVTIGIR